MSDDQLLDDPLDDELDALYRQQPVDAPPPDFVDAVMARRMTERERAPTEPAPNPTRGRRRRAAPWLAAMTVAAAAVALLVLRFPTTTEGALDAKARETVRIEDRAVVVAEAGATLRWTVADGALTVHHERGRAFYRLDDGATTVRTPAGEVRITGTCFTVEVDEMSPALKSGAMGALIGVAATIIVYEGTVEARNDDGHAVVSAGQQVRLEPGTTPRVTDTGEAGKRRAAKRPTPEMFGEDFEVEMKRLALEAAGEALSEMEEARSELDRTRAQLERLEGQLERERAMRRETEGEPVPFPAGVPDIFREDALRRNVEAALAEAGIEGEVVSVDCAEYPCIVYTDMANDDDKALDALNETDAMSDYEGAARSISAMGRHTKEDDGETSRRTFAGISLMPKDEAGEDLRGLIGKRLRFRNQQAFEAFADEFHPGGEEDEDERR